METTVQRFETGISANNLKNWGELEVVKELLQNAVYAKTILGDKVTIGYDEVAQMLYINNTPSGFSKGKLLIGESEQAEVEGAPGQYGEGMKVAMAVARRLGLQCDVVTNGFSVKPELEPSSLDPNVNVLVFYIEDHDMHNGTGFMVQCSKEVYEQAEKSFAVLQGVAPEQVSKTGIMRGIGGGQLYVNGVHIYTTPAVLSYNFTNPKLMNRDRSTVDMWEVKREVGQLMNGMIEMGMLLSIVKAIVKDDTLLEAGVAPQRENEYWLKAFQQHYGKTKLALSTTTEANTQAQYRQYKVISVPSQWEYYLNECGVPFTDELQKAAKKKARIHRKPKGDDSANLGWAKRLVKLYYGDYGTVKIADDLYDEHDCKCNGLYSRSTDVTWIDSSILGDKEQLFKTLLHETIHRVSGALDNTTAFTREWEKATWGILTRGKGHM